MVAEYGHTDSIVDRKCIIKMMKDAIGISINYFGGVVKMVINTIVILCPFSLRFWVIVFTAKCEYYRKAQNFFIFKFFPPPTAPQTRNYTKKTWEFLHPLIPMFTDLRIAYQDGISNAKVHVITIYKGVAFIHTHRYIHTRGRSVAVFLLP